MPFGWFRRSGQKHPIPPVLEVRAYRFETTLGADAKTIHGHAALFGVLSERLEWGFRERIAPGAFGDVASADVRALWNHSDMHVIGRTRAGTLRLSIDARGLGYEADIPDTAWARDLVVSLRRKDVDQSSFRFRTMRDSWVEERGEQIRTLEQVTLYDVSPVTFPAYTQTDAAARSICGLDEHDLAEACCRVECGMPEPGDIEMLRACVAKMQAMMTDPGEPDGAPPMGRSVDLLRRRLDLLARLV
jgi:HK97 family phage prohead protease